ncbi:NAD(P)/FAD-dependent oxidoreductase [Patescibacteria group bacterium]|nr:NAD(P)/FAD-dependent oxidoreductase [Patescibacteria group bacterium]
MKYDLVVIGGGPSGMMAALRAGELGARVLLVEKNDRLGVKLLMTGNGRCNLTNSELERRKVIDKFGKNGRFLFSSYFRFDNNAVVEFFENQGVKTKVERGGRVFPESDLGADVLSALIECLKKSKVEIKTDMSVKEIVKKENRIEEIVFVNGETVVADHFIIATGGKSYPGSGSSGDGYDFAKKLGHTITPLMPALTPIILEERFIPDLEGLALKNVEVSVFQNNKKIDSRFGEALFTGNGLSGPIILDLSRTIGQALAQKIGKIVIKIDFKPALNLPQLDLWIQEDFKKGQNKMVKNILDGLLPQRIIPIFISQSEINPEKKVNSITKEERKKLLLLLKEFTLTVGRLVGFEKAIVTSGGVSLREIDPKTMRSKIVDNLSFAGEVLDLDGPTGGYNLQACFCTGRSAGENVIAHT